ncbi:hypothetical protein HU200_043470 [Digitaria exilis]|uniref:GIR1-like zinc ribbon domain-containing protein n=1 Tax=Digitaria exilis TaxID=1010633 RepID=A0A835B346_9POAL|nr:hypothetical protein HU200_043470 [Digitaria exilis]CAB3446795.1 unnamed protein product [Digitaria exilis]
MSRGGGLDLKLHLSPPAPARGGAARASSDEEWSSSSSSSPSSCLSSEGEREPPHRLHHGLQWSDSPEATSMVLAACPRCLMYVMLSEADPRCPRCRSPVLLDFLHHAGVGNTGNVVGGGGGGGREGGVHGRNSSTPRGGGRRNSRA